MSQFPRKDGLPRDDRGRIIREAVEYSVVNHCNLRCAGCDHAAPHLTRQFADPSAFAEDMSALGRHLHVRVLRLLGGEPLLHPALDAFVRTARDTAVADRVMLWTNGALLHEVRREVLKSFDVVRVSLYPGVRVQIDLADLARDLERSGSTSLEVIHVKRFQYQNLNAPIPDGALVRRTYLRCHEAHSLSCHTVADGRYYKCPKAPVLEPRLAACGVEIANRTRDGVALRQNPRLAEELSHYLLSDDPLMACAWCLGTDGKSFSHHQLDPAGLRLERNTGGADGRSFFAGPVRRLLRDLRQCLAKH